MSPSHVKFLLARRLLVGQLEVFGFDTIHATHGADVVVRRKVVFDMTLEAVEILFTRSFCVGRGHALPRSSCSNPPTSPARPFPSPPPRRKRPQTKPNEASLRFATSREPNKKKQKMAKRGETSNGPAHQRSTRERGCPKSNAGPFGRQYLNPEVRRLCPSNISPGRVESSQTAQGVVSGPCAETDVETTEARGTDLRRPERGRQ